MPLSNSIQLTSPLKGVILTGRLSNGNGRRSATGDAEDKAREANRESAELAYKRGLEEGKELAIAEFKIRQEELEQQLHSILDALAEEREALGHSLHELLPELVIEGVGSILYGLEPDAKLVKRIVSEILDDFDGEESQMRLSMNPDDIETLKGNDEKFSELHPELRIQADEKLHRGECRLDSRFGVTDARFSAKLAGLRKVFE